MIGRAIEELAVGDWAEVARVVSRDTVRDFVETTGDANPMHSDAAFAAQTRFGEVIAPGLLTGSLVSAVIGTRLPGPGTIYLSQDFHFRRPVRLGETVTARVEVAEVHPERNRVRLRTVCLNQEGEVVLDGEAWVLPPARQVRYEPAPATAAEAWHRMALAPWRWALHAATFWMVAGLALAAPSLRPAPPPSSRA